jgi:bifunctional non-homologous end joining protein LigD
MALEAYRSKRRFGSTPEPEGAEGGKRGRRHKRASAGFVVQKHAARRLHYDLRLEHEGVLWSWAVTRGPSLVPGEKRLAVRTEDHPLEYASFEGTIPKGDYGAGTVIVWDEGSWLPLADPEKGIAKGHLEFELAGGRLGGRWHLVRMAAKPREKKENWLLIKGDDAQARDEGARDVLEEHVTSIRTGRSIEAVAAGEEAAPAGARTPPRVKGAVTRGFPGFVAPALATLRPEASGGERWVHEIKFDGYRLQAHVRGGRVELLTRNGFDWTERFGAAVREALAGLPVEEAILDGELVVEGAGGASDFSALQADLAEGRAERFVYYAFDLLYLDGLDLRGAGLEARKAALAERLAGAPAVLRFSEHFDEDGEIILRHACRLSLEGVVSKLRDGAYRSGRGRGWIKSKCRQRQEFVILGYAPSSVARGAIGALLLGHHADGELVPVGRVGTGFSARVAGDLFRRLEPLRRERPAFAGRLDAEARRGLVFVEPELVAEVEFVAWTADGTLRHASFRGLREDKPAGEVVREEGPSAPVDRAPAAVRLTHPDRLYWAEAGVTKEGLAGYYAQVWRWMAPHVVGRPLALLRCPGGTGGQCFFQKHAWRGQSKEILRLRDPLDEGEDASLLAVDGLPGLIGMVQGAALELHGWQATTDDLERPDQIVMDLDPGEGVELPAIVAAAREVRARLEAAGLESFVKTTGGKGLHVVAPLVPKAGWAEVKGFAKAVADAMAADAPERYVATVSKAKRRGRILVDYLRNGRGATAVAPYSTRAREGAPVSMPLDWGELDGGIGPAYFTVANAPGRLARLERDPWEDFRAAAAPLEAKKARKRA